MKLSKRIITILLLFFQMISMAHIMFHHQMHALIEGEDICVVFKNHHDCCSGCNHTDHNNCSHEDSCKSDREFVAEDSHRLNIADRAIELPSFLISSTTLLALTMQSVIREKFKEYNADIPLSPTINHFGLRAPPVVC